MPRTSSATAPAEVTVKLAYNGELRRLRVGASAGFAGLHAAASQRLGAPPLEAALLLTWTDEDGDIITVATDADWEEAVASAGGGTVKLTATTTAAGSPAAPAPAPATAPKKTFLSMLVDRSGSMRALGPEVLGGVQAYLDQVAGDDAKDGSSTDVLFATFDNAYQVVHPGAALAEVRAKVTAADLEPRGMTALWDGIGYVLRDTEAKLAGLPAGSKPDKVIVFILTDGQENTSREWSSAAVKKRIAELEKAGGYEFFFAAAGQDALHTGASIGLKAEDCITWEAGDRGSAQATFAACATNHNMAKRGMSKAFSPAQRASASPMADPRRGPPAGAGFGFGGGGGGGMGRLATPRRRPQQSGLTSAWAGPPDCLGPCVLSPGGH